MNCARRWCHRSESPLDSAALGTMSPREGLLRFFPVGGMAADDPAVTKGGGDSNHLLSMCGQWCLGAGGRSLEPRRLPGLMDAGWGIRNIELAHDPSVVPANVGGKGESHMDPTDPIDKKFAARPFPRLHTSGMLSPTRNTRKP